MKIYHSLSEASQAFKRKSKQVFAIVSFNGQAYFVFRSNPDAQAATMMQAQNKMAIGNELLGQDPKNIDPQRKKQLYKFLVDAGVPQRFPEQSRHAEENLIRAFPAALNAFKAAYPGQKISKIDVFLTHSPCSEQGNRKYSAPCKLNNFFLPAGCDKKLAVFFKNKNYTSVDINLFSKNPTVRVRYNHIFDISLCNDNEFVKKADPILKNVLRVLN